MEIKNKYLKKILIILEKIDNFLIMKKQKTKEKNKISFENIKKFIIKKTIIKQNKNLLLSYLANGLKRGNNLLTLITKYKETLDVNDREEKILIELLIEIENIIKTKGTSISYILFQVGLLTEKEYLIISNYNDLHVGLELVLKMNKQHNKFNWAITLFFFPPFIVLIGLTIFQPELKDFAYEAIAPINEQSTQMIRIPEYLETRNVFMLSTILFIMIYILIMYSINMVKKFKPFLYFKFFRLAEKEFIVNTFSALSNLRKSGKSYIQSYLILSETTKDTFKKKFYLDIYNQSKEGNRTSIYDVCKKYNMDKFNLSYFKTGVLNNDLDNTILTILEYNEEKYNRQVALLVKYLPLVGEIIMTLIILKPLIDIIMVTTVDVMNFTL